jgi:predicted negative regulator of RcsB-dependent stress response
LPPGGFDCADFWLLNWSLAIPKLLLLEGKFVRSQTRHQLKEDRFRGATIEAAEATVHWSVEHKNNLIIGAVIAVVVAAVAVGGWYYMNQQDQKASFDLTQAVRTLDTPLRPVGMPAQPDYASFGSSQERATAAQKQLHAIVDKYPHTHSAEIAHYFLGQTSADLGDNTAAERELKTVASKSNRDLAALANLSLASVYRNCNRNKDAIEIYKKLSDKPTSTVTKAAAQMELAATYQADNQPVEAKRVYAQVQKDNPSSQIAQLASQKSNEIK